MEVALVDGSGGRGCAGDEACDGQPDDEKSETSPHGPSLVERDDQIIGDPHPQHEMARQSPSTRAGAQGEGWRVGLANPRWLAGHTHRSTRTTSNCLAVGGMPVSNLAFTTASLLPKRAAVVGIWNSGLVMTASTPPALRSGRSRIRLTWLLKFCTAHSRPASSTIPSTLGTLTPAMVALAPVVGSTVSSWAFAEWATIRVLPLAVAWMPLRLTAPFPMRVAAGPLRARVRNVSPGTPARLTG